MKKIAILALFIASSFISCKAKNNTQPTENQTNTQTTKEVETIESEITEMDNTKKEIENLSNELDILLQEIDK